MTASSRPQQKDGIGGAHDPRSTSRIRHRKSQTRSRVFRELVDIAAAQGASISLGVSTADALQECLDRAVALYRFASDQVDHLTADLDSDNLSNLPLEQDPLYEVIPNPQGPDVVQSHRYIIMEREARIEIEKLATMMTQLGIAERAVQLQEAQAVLMIAHIREAAIEAGIPNDQIRALGESLRKRVEGGLRTTAPAFATAHNGVPEAARASRQIEESLDAHDA